MANKKETGRDQEQQLLKIYKNLAPSQKYAFVLGRIYALLKAGNDISDIFQKFVDDADADLKNFEMKDDIPKKEVKKNARKKRA